MTTLAEPVTPGGVLMIKVAAVAVKTVAALPPMVTEDPGAKPDPITMKVVPPAAGPMLLTVLLTTGVGLKADDKD